MDWLKGLGKIHNIDPITEEVYGELIDFFDTNSKLNGYRGNIDRLPRPTDSENLMDIANEIYGYFSAHYFKARNTFIELEKVNKVETIIKDNITIVDIGSGIGTATYALLDLIRINNPIISINILFIELSKTKTELLKMCIENYRTKCPGNNISYVILNKAFPECIEDVKDFVLNETNILLIMSNLVNWLNKNPLEMGKGIHKINLENPDIYDIKVINIEGHTLEEKIKKQYEYLENKGIYLVNGPDKVTNKLIYKNATKSYWHEIKKIHKPYHQKGGYVHGSIRSIPLIKAVCSSRMLEIAFFKARYAHRTLGITDEIEIKYIESNLKNIIRLIQDQISSSSFYKYSKDFLEYNIPKNEKDTRPYVVEDFINDIVSSSLIISMGDTVDDEQDIFKQEEYSFGNRLNEELRSPYLFEPFAQKYFNEYIKKAKNFSEEPSYTHCVQADIKSFYTMIDKNKLKQYLDDVIPDTIKWVKNTMNSFIERQYNGCKLLKGLPQGVFLSNLLANLYLTKLDSEISKKHNLKYVRYVDDFFIFCQGEEEAKNVKAEVEKVIQKELLLVLNKDKSGVIDTKSLVWPGNRDLFQEFNNKINKILRSLYKIDSKNYKQFKKEPEIFITSLQKSLTLIGVYIPRNWLQIKIISEISFIERMLNKFKNPKSFFNWSKKKDIYGYNIKWGKIPNNSNQRSLEKWKENFKNNNPKLIKDIEDITNELEYEFLSNFRILANDNDLDDSEKKERLRIAKFCFNHLGRFISVKIPSELNNIIKKPWLLNLRPLRAYPQIAPELIKLLDEEREKENNYLLLNIVWLLGEMREKSAISKIYSIYIATLDTYKKEEILLNSLCTEALLKINFWQNIPFEALQKIVEKWISIEKAPVYRLVRNSLMILSNSDLNYRGIIQSGMKLWENNQKIVTFLNWFDEVENPNIIDEFDYITEEVKKMYPLTEPEPNNYLS